MDMADGVRLRRAGAAAQLQLRQGYATSTNKPAGVLGRCTTWSARHSAGALDRRARCAGRDGRAGV